MKRKLVPENKEAIREWIAKVERRSWRRLLTVDELFQRVEEIEKRLTEGFCVPKKYWKGLKFRVGQGVKVANAYNGIPLSTVAYISRSAAGWTITDITRERLNHNIEPLFSAKTLNELSDAMFDVFQRNPVWNRREQ